MNISVKSEYALKAIFDLVAQSLAEPHGSPTSPVKIADIAKRQRIPQKFLELILAGLKQNGFLDSRRGAEGGYLLAKLPDAIMLGEVLRAVESTRSSGKQGEEDPFGPIWQRVDAAVSGVLDETSFGELARSWKAKNRKYVANWEI